MLAACRTPSKATELQQLVKDHPGQLHLLTLDVTNESSIEVKILLCSGCAHKCSIQESSCKAPDAACRKDLTSAMPAQAAAAEAVKLCPHGIDVLINNADGLRPGGSGLELMCQRTNRTPWQPTWSPCRDYGATQSSITNVRSCHWQRLCLLLLHPPWRAETGQSVAHDSCQLVTELPDGAARASVSSSVPAAARQSITWRC